MFRKFAQDERGNVSLLGAASLIAIVGLAAFAVELGQGYSARVDNQRVADTAALGAALAYSGSEDVAVLTATAQSIAAAQGILASQVAAALIASPTGDGSQAVQVTVTTPVALRLARVFTSTASMNISARSIASLSGGGPACILALSPTASKGISAVGATNLTATDCGIAANMNISTTGSASIVGETVRTGGSVSSTGASSVTTAPEPNKVTQNVDNAAVDPLDGDPDLASALGQLGTYTPPLNAVVGVTGSDFKPGWSGSYSHSGYTGTFSNGTNTWTFPSGIYNIKNLDVGGGLKVVFQGPVTLNVSGKIASTGAGLTIGDGPVNVVGAVEVSGGSNLTIGAGRHYFGSIKHSGNTMIVGAGDLDIAGGIELSGSSILTFGDGNVAIGTGTGAMKDLSIKMAGSSKLTFGDGTFSAKGGITTAGGSFLRIGATINHYVNGDITLHGAALLGEGRYIINGGISGNGGAGSWPAGTTLGGVNVSSKEFAGVNVTLILNGEFDMGAQKTVYLTAPSATTAGGSIANLAIATNTNDDVSFGAGSNSIVTGMIHAPQSAVSVTGGAALSGGGGCFMMVADTVTLNGSGVGATICPGMGGGNSAEVMLLQ